MANWFRRALEEKSRPQGKENVIADTRRKYYSKGRQWGHLTTMVYGKTNLSIKLRPRVSKFASSYTSLVPLHSEGRWICKIRRTLKTHVTWTSDDKSKALNFVFYHDPTNGPRLDEETRNGWHMAHALRRKRVLPYAFSFV
eukprot:scaffold2318_cov363-Pavlova_lutheri.AAC.5